MNKPETLKPRTRRPREREPKPDPAATRADPLWYKDAAIYQVHIKSFFDSNNDGIGDFPGLTAKLDYLLELGANAIWLLPFYPSPRRDDGYDIAEYKDVHPDYGTLDDVRRFIDEAHARGIRVITELVVNHTSDKHPWFQRARTAPPGSPERDFYVWSQDDKAYAGTRIIFIDTEKSNWTWDETAQAYYWHRFYAHQPDLNFDNPQVLEAVLDVMRFWLDLGVDGLRLDAVPYLVEREGTNNENLPETHSILKRIRAEVDARYQNRMLLAEANQWPEDVQQYFGDGDECHMLFHFPLMPRMYMALAQEDRFPITDIMRQTPDIPPDCQWAIFLRNHDELTLEMVTDKERDYLWKFYATDNRARLNLGIRRRLAPLLEHDRRRIELLNSLLFTMPGTPVIYYGDEIGMGDNIHLGDRDGVRTPMQWSPDRNGGFSRADPAALVLPVIMDPLYGYEAVNVESQTRDPYSLLNWLKRLLAVRHRHKAFGRGTLRFLRPQNRKVLAYLREHEGETILCVANVSRTAQAVELDLSEFAGRTPVELLGGGAFPAAGQLSYLLTLPPFGFYWFYLSADATPPEWSTVTTGSGSGSEFDTFVLRDGLKDVFSNPARQALERDVLAKYIAQRRWYQTTDDAVESVHIAAFTPWPKPDSDFAFADVDVTSGGVVTRYAFPLAISWEDTLSSPLETPLALARVRKRARVGLLTDGFASAGFAHVLVDGLAQQARISFGDGEIRFRPAPGLDLAIGPDTELDWPSGEQTNSSLTIGRQAIVKLLRRAVEGIHPEAEMVGLLTERGFTGIAPLLGEIERVGADGTTSALALVQRFVANQGDGFKWTLDQLNRLVDSHAMAREPDGNRFEPYRNLAHRMGFRLGEMHAILAQPSQNPDFAPEAVSAAMAGDWRESVVAQVEAAFSILDAEKPEKGGLREKTIAQLAGLRGRLPKTVETILQPHDGMVATRIHGDLHLGQILVTAGDVIFIDFEGEPLKTLAARRAKASPLRDVAGMLRSFDYAARIVARDAPAAHSGISRKRALKIVADFRQMASETLLDGYGEGRGRALEAGERKMLTVFALEKAAYEILYEAAHRPQWLDLPLSGFTALASDLCGARA